MTHRYAYCRAHPCAEIVRLSIWQRVRLVLFQVRPLCHKCRRHE